MPGLSPRAGSIQAAGNFYALLDTLPTPGLLRESLLAGVIAVLAIAWPAGQTLCPRLVSPASLAPALLAGPTRRFRPYWG